MTVNPPRALHLPDLPEVSVQIGGPAPGPDGGLADGLQNAPAPGQPPRPQPALGYRLRQALSSYLPLLLMALLAASTAWLVKHTPQASAPAGMRAPREAPDYSMTGFAIVRFAPDGSEALRIAGDVLHHYPATDELEIDGVRIHAVAPDGRRTDAVARRALAKGDGSEVTLLGGAQVRSQIDGEDALLVQGEVLHALLRLQKLRSDLPVQVRRGNTETRAGGLDYDHKARQLRLLGPVRATWLPGQRGELPTLKPLPAP